MEESGLFPETIAQGTKMLFFNLGEAESRYAFEIMQTARKAGLSCEIYHEQAKFDKQFKYAEKKRIPYIVIAGSEELANGTCKVKNLETGEQRTIEKTELVSYFDD
jgi:histidyl-tRNA synthetase